MQKHHWNILFLLLGNAIGFFAAPSPLNYWVIGGTWLLFALFLSIGISLIRFQYFFKSINYLQNGKVLLTFDDGPAEKYTPEILKILDQHEIGSIFFVIGNKVEKSSQIISLIKEHGHLIGNHTYSHPNNFALLSQKRIVEEIDKGQVTLAPFSEMDEMLFRTPIGVTNPIIGRAVRATNVSVIGWSLRTMDTRVKNPSKWLDKIIQSTQKNDIVLFHDTQAITAEHLNHYIVECKNRGIEFVSKDSLKNVFHA